MIDKSNHKNEKEDLQTVIESLVSTRDTLVEVSLILNELLMVAELQKQNLAEYVEQDILKKIRQQ